MAPRLLEDALPSGPEGGQHGDRYDEGEHTLEQQQGHPLRQPGRMLAGQLSMALVSLMPARKLSAWAGGGAAAANTLPMTANTVARMRIPVSTLAQTRSVLFFLCRKPAVKISPTSPYTPTMYRTTQGRVGGADHDHPQVAPTEHPPDRVRLGSAVAGALVHLDDPVPEQEREHRVHPGSRRR